MEVGARPPGVAPDSADPRGRVPPPFGVHQSPQPLQIRMPAVRAHSAKLPTVHGAFAPTRQHGEPVWKTPRMDDPWVYVVTDIETDGPHPGPNSMRSFASVAVSLDGTEHGRFEAVLEELPGAAPNPRTLEWFQSVPEAWAAATENPRPISNVMADYVTWVKALPGATMFAASPMAFDGCWIDYYLRRFTNYGVVQGPDEEDRLFDGVGLCIRSYAAAVTGQPTANVSPETMPAEWFGDVEHTHRAIDDALGYANLLVMLASKAASNPRLNLP